MIKAIKITNFKSIKEATIALPNFGMIIGKNGAGKTTLISAINLTQKLTKEMELEKVIAQIAPFSKELFFQGKSDNPCEIEIIIELSKDSIFRYKYSIVLAVKEQKAKLIIDTESLSKIHNGNEVPIYVRNENTVFEIVNNQKNAILLKVTDNKLALSYYPNEEVTNLVNRIRDYTIIEPTDVGKMDSQRLISEQNPDLKMIDGLIVSLYTKSPKLFEKASEAIKQVIPNFIPPTVFDTEETISNPSRPNNGEAKPEEPSIDKSIKNYFVIWNDQNNMRYSSISMSGGNLRTCFLLYSLFNSSEKSLMAIEELENGMHIGRIARLIDEFRTQSNNRSLQILFTTHSIEMPERVLLKEVIFCHKNESNGSKYEIMPETEAYKAIKEDLEDKEPSFTDLFQSGLLNI